MPTFSLLSVSETNPDGTVDGYWIQDCIGSYENALEKAAQTSLANSDCINIAIVEGVYHPTPRLEYWTNRRVISK